MEIEYFVKNTEKFLELLNSQLDHFSTKTSTMFDESNNPLSSNYVPKQVELTDFDDANFLFSRIDMMLGEYPSASSLFELLQKYKDSNLPRYYPHHFEKADLFKTKVYLKALIEFQEHLKGIEEYSIEKELNS